MRYDNYVFCPKEWAIYSIEYLFLCGAVAYLFYDSLIAFFVFLPGSIFYFKRVKKKCIANRINDLKGQFIQMISCMSTSLCAGLSIENSLIEARKDIRKMYESEIMLSELNDMIAKMNLGIRLEDLLMDFSNRTGVEEIKDFAVVFGIAKRSGGKFSEIIERCSSMMISNRETESQIQIMLSGKKYEQKIMSIIPFILIASLRYTSPDFIGVFYHNVPGNIMMTICLLIYALSIYLAEKICNIKC